MPVNDRHETSIHFFLSPLLLAASASCPKVRTMRPLSKSSN
jgi:hypothetical protein